MTNRQPRFIMKQQIASRIKKYKISEKSLSAPYSALQWRYERPEWDKDRCFKCGICYLSCPDAAIYEIEEGYYDVDADSCKGCGICAERCINESITMITEDKDIVPVNRFFKKGKRR